MANLIVDSRTVRAQAAIMGDLIDMLGRRSRWLADPRGRSLKATWHPEAEMVVLSLWEIDRCVGTFQLSAGDAPQLMVLLAEAVEGRSAQPYRGATGSTGKP